MPTAEAHAGDSRAAAEGERLGGEVPDRERTVTIDDPVETASGAAVGVQVAAQRRVAADGGVGAGVVGVKQGVVLGVAEQAGSALDPDHVAARVEHQGGWAGRGTYPHAGEVLAAALR